LFVLRINGSSPKIATPSEIYLELEKKQFSEQSNSSIHKFKEVYLGLGYTAVLYNSNSFISLIRQIIDGSSLDEQLLHESFKT
jgi:hypothetical protein